LKQIHRRRVANGVRGNAATAQRWAVRLSGLNVRLKPLLNGGPSHRLSEAIGQQRLIWFKTGKLQPGTDVPSGFLSEGHRALLSAFAQQLHGMVIVSLHVLHPDRESFGHAGSGVVEKKKEQMIAPSAPGIVHGLQEGLHFALRKKVQQRTGESFQGNCHDPLGLGDHFRSLACADIAKKRAQCSQAQVAGPYTITTLLFQVLQKGDQLSGRQIGKHQLIGSLAASPLQKAQ
jgi:hypothetical protein